jgi:predicted nucleic acid-binding protein
VRLALDTNILVYAESTAPGAREDLARVLVQRLPPDRLVLPAQVLGELFNVLTRKAKLPAAQARSLVTRWMATYEVVPTSADVLDEGFELAALHRFASWDAIIVAAAAQAGCRYLLSEDMQDGFTWRGVTVANPFATAPLPPPLAALLAANG